MFYSQFNHICIIDKLAVVQREKYQRQQQQHYNLHFNQLRVDLSIKNKNKFVANLLK